ncbi:MAG: response regulator transcription factor [Candidatus Melainabacteria bacterium]|nr:response regulator transcription factor [Candidatus Melainabacteria bacterium]
MAEQTPDASAPSINVLLVEDHQLTRLGLKVALHRTKDIHVIGEASNGQEALTMAEKLKPDVILMDVGMPVMDGIQAASQIVARDLTMKIIMLTQHDNDADILASLAAGASGYCLKDVEPERLYTAIRAVSNGDVWLDSAVASRVLKHYSANPALSGVQLEAAPLTSSSNRNSSDMAFSSDTSLAVAASDNNSADQEMHESQDKTSSAPGIDRPAPEALSPRELEVIKLIVDGLSNQEISDRLVVSLATTKTHVRNILNKLAVDDRTQAAVHAMRRGLV